MKSVGQKSKFVLNDDVPDIDMMDIDVMLRKEDYGVPGTTEFRKNMQMATAPLSNKFGVAKHKIMSGASQDGDQNNYLSIERTIVSMIHRVKEGHNRSQSMDFMEICNLPKLEGNLESDMPEDWWDESETNVWIDFDKVDYETVLAWQYSINKRFSVENRIASRFLKEFVYNSSTDSLKEAVGPKYEKLPRNQRGGVIYTYLTLCEMFVMSREVKQAMLNFLDSFKKSGLTKYAGENVLLAASEVLGVCKRLDAVKSLQDEHVHDVLTGLAICNNSRFKGVFKLLAENADLGNIAILPSIDANATVIEAIEAVFEHGMGLHDKLCQAQQWNMAKKDGGRKSKYLAGAAWVQKCWNCGKAGCNVGTCSEPKNQERINKNRKASGEAYRKHKKSEEDKPKTNSGGGGKDKTSADYKRKKWASSGMSMVNGSLMCNCAKCGLNETHTTKFHTAWEGDKNNFKLPSSHPFVKERALLGVGTPTAGAIVPFVPSQVQPPPTQNPDLLTFSRAQLESRIASTERNSADPNAVSLATMMRELFLN